MKLEITKYVTKVDENDENRGTHFRYSIMVEDKDGVREIKNLGEFELIKAIIEEF